MEEEWIVDRSKLREIWFEHPNWSRKKMAKEVGRSEAWVRKWLKRIRQAPLADREVLNGYSRVPHKLPPSIPEEVVHKILDIRDHPPQPLGRVPGPLTIMYYLSKEPSLIEKGVKLPSSTSTVWKILDKHHKIPRPFPPMAEPEERPAPGVEWGMDFHDVSTVPAEPEGKQQHVVEILPKDIGTMSIWSIMVPQPSWLQSPPVTTLLKQRSAQWPLFCRKEVVQIVFALTAIRAGWVVGRPRIFPRRCCAFCNAWELSHGFVHLDILKKILLSSAIIATSNTNAS
jgi:hypothetical protein